MMSRFFVASVSLILFLSVSFYALSARAAFGLNVDELYRQMIKEENAGILPLYAQKDGAVRTDVSLPSGSNMLEIPEGEDEDVLRRQQREAKEKIWKEVIIAVKTGQPTPFDISEIEKRTEESDAEAVELLAWMNAMGVGMKKNLPKAWLLYNEASRLGVVDAKTNADAIYKALSVKKSDKK